MEIIVIIGIIIVMLGIILIFDARQLSKERFSFSDQNEAANILKLAGFLISIVGGFLILLG